MNKLIVIGLLGTIGLVLPAVLYSPRQRFRAEVPQIIKDDI